MRDYHSVIEVFELLNECNVEYLVLRNFDNLLSPEIYQDGHGDIDLLCRDSQQIASLLDAGTDYTDVPPFKGDGTHYYITVDGKRVSLDLRYVGDGYYCEQWQNDMLAQRKQHECYFIMDDKNHFYSLVYHAILQKPSLSEEYRFRLTTMAKQLGLTAINEKQFLNLLQNHMQSHGYKFCYPIDYHVPCRFCLIDKQLVDFDTKLWWHHTKYQLRNSSVAFLVRIKHLFVKP